MPSASSEQHPVASSHSLLVQILAPLGARGQAGAGRWLQENAAGWSGAAPEPQHKEKCEPTAQAAAAWEQHPDAHIAVCAAGIMTAAEFWSVLSLFRAVTLLAKPWELCASVPQAAWASCSLAQPGLILHTIPSL